MFRFSLHLYSSGLYDQKYYIHKKINFCKNYVLHKKINSDLIMRNTNLLVIIYKIKFSNAFAFTCFLHSGVFIAYFTTHICSVVIIWGIKWVSCTLYISICCCLYLLEIVSIFWCFGLNCILMLRASTTLSWKAVDPICKFSSDIPTLSRNMLQAWCCFNS